MAGRIRTIKPEIRDDDVALSLSDEAWRLWVSSWTIADDHGNLRADARYLGAEVWRDTGRDVARPVLELVQTGRWEPYSVAGQRYVHVHAWDRHQRIDNAGKPRVPTPKEDDGEWLRELSEFSSTARGKSRPVAAKNGELPLARARAQSSRGRGTLSSEDPEHESEPEHDRARARDVVDPKGIPTPSSRPGDFGMGFQRWVLGVRRGLAPRGFAPVCVGAKADGFIRTILDAHGPKDPATSLDWLEAQGEAFARQADTTRFPLEVFGFSRWLNDGKPDRALKPTSSAKPTSSGPSYPEYVEPKPPKGFRRATPAEVADITKDAFAESSTKKAAKAKPKAPAAAVTNGATKVPSMTTKIPSVIPTDEELEQRRAAQLAALKDHPELFDEEQKAKAE